MSLPLHLHNLAAADPDVAGTVAQMLRQREETVTARDVALLEEQTLWALALEPSLGKTVARGLSQLIGRVDYQGLQAYCGRVHAAAEEGPTFARLLAAYLVPVVRSADASLLRRFDRTVSVMKAKGTYTLKAPLEGLQKLFEAGDGAALPAYLDLLQSCFAKELTYNQSQYLTNLLPRAVLRMQAAKRPGQIVQLRRVLQKDVRLTDAFLDGMQAGLRLLSVAGLSAFVARGLRRARRSRRVAASFLSLESKSAEDTFRQMQVAVSLGEVAPSLTRYLRARTASQLAVRPLSALGNARRRDPGAGVAVCSDGQAIYLPEELECFASRSANVGLYKALIRFEAALYEYGTFDFDLAMLAGRCTRGWAAPPTASARLSDLEQLWQYFRCPALAEDLFTTFEHGRLRLLLARHYPGLVRRALPLFQREARRIRAAAGPAGLRADFYNHIALGLRFSPPDAARCRDAPLRQAVRRFEKQMAAAPTVRTCARLLLATYFPLAAVLLHEQEKADPAAYTAVPIPFGRRLRPDLFASAHAHYEKTAQKIKDALASRGLQVFRASIRNRLIRGNGRLEIEDLKAIVLEEPVHGRPPGASAKASEIAGQLPDPRDLGLEFYFPGSSGGVVFDDGASLPRHRYREWDDHLEDYLTDHVWVREHRPETAGAAFYRNVLERHSSLVHGIRRSFELLKPEGMAFLRQWEEGESFDYRALLDFAIDRKARRPPSPRIYIKRLKKIRDVAVLLLVDMSRSTANRVAGSNASVLDVEKEAIVVFCEALKTVGDKFAVAGFSGSGRLAVDYYRIKDFGEGMGGNAAGRIAAMMPQRATRMGGALRHATARLLETPARVRLLVLLGDGFPNDVDYKRRYAMEDTRKALAEARARSIYTHAITVNLAADVRLDDLYGSVHHTIIADVRELPERLWRIYGALTRH